MDPAVIGARLASSAVTPLVKKLFVSEGAGAGLTDRPVRISALVSFRGEKRTLTEKDLRALAAELVDRGSHAMGPHDRPADEVRAVVSDTLARTLHGLGDLDMDDVQAVRLGHRALARSLRASNTRALADLPADAASLHDSLLETACLHVLHFFTQRSSFVARTLVAQSRALDGLTARVDELIARTPRPGSEDAAYERRYLDHIATKHGRLTIYGIDLTNSPGRWPLDVAYLSLEATLPEPSARRGTPGQVRSLLDEAMADIGRTNPVASSHPRADGWSGPPGLDGTFTMADGIVPELDVPADPRPADQALASHERVLLRGVAGSGKTTLVQWLAVSAARRVPDERLAYLRDRIPFVLPLRTLTRHGERLPSPGDFLAAVGSPLSGAQPRGWERRVLEAGRGLLLVDGIDEIPDGERDRTRDWMRDLLDVYPGNRWLVTSRPSAVRENWLADDGFAELGLSAMSRQDVAEFIRRWHTAARGTGGTDAGAPDADGELAAYETSLLTAVRTKPDLGRLATNPLMCGLICALHRDRRGYLPQGRKELYGAALSMLLIRRDRERAMSGPEVREEPQLQLLQRLAYWLIRNGRTEMDRAQAERLIAAALPAVPEVARLGDAPAVFEHFLQRSGLLREPGPDSVDFVHRTFQDFLGARAAVDEGDFGLLAQHASDDQWEDVVRMAVAQGRPRERAEIFAHLLAQGDHAAAPAVRARIFLLAAACLEHAAELDPAVREEVEARASTLVPPRNPQEARELASVGPIVLDLLPGPGAVDNEDAVLVVSAASHVDSDAAIPFLGGFAGHRSLAVRSQLVWGWSRFDTAAYADEVIARLDPDDLYFTVRSDEQLDALRELGTRPLLDARGTISAGALAAYGAPARLTGVKVHGNDALTDLSFLRGQDALAGLTVNECRAVEDLSSLDGLPLRSLEFDATAGLDGLSALSRLEHLLLGTRYGALWSLDALPREAPLTLLDLSRASMPERGLRGLSHWSGLDALVLSHFTSRLSPADWAELAALPGLSALRLSFGAFGNCPDSLALPSVSDLVLLHADTPAHPLGRVPGLFPGLARLQIVGDESARYALDLTPLAELPWLEQVVLPRGEAPVLGLSRLPAEVKIINSA
ncbi:NACHT domain-containing protein [Streptomyces sp. NPDC047108]|uniref:NACHT domain-containing protein n=1 Tax=Streptomyces sp. NPDC047108 TaxID=3155025 RepID=UPI0033E63BD6